MASKPGVLGKAILCGVAALSLGEGSAFAQTAPGAGGGSEGAAEPEQSLGTIVVTGTRRLDRTVADSAVPIDVIDTTALTNQGSANELGAILNNQVPSFNFPRPSQSDGTDMVRVATLRGLGPDQTLVLIDGKRRHSSSVINDQLSIGEGSAGVDLNAIPISAIKRIEVLRDGAAAQYGSDAIAGVINIILKDNASSGEATASIGKYYTTVKGVPKVTGLQSVNGQPVVDFTDGFGVPVFKANTSGDRSAADGFTYTLSSDIGLPIGDRGFANLALEVAHRNATNRSGYELGQNYDTLPSGLYDPRELTFNRLDASAGDGTEKDYKVFLNSGYKLDGDTKLYLFANDSRRNGTAYQYYRNAASLAADNGGRDCNINQPLTSTGACPPFFANGFLPVEISTIKDYQVVLGVKGLVSDWHYDVSLNDGQNRYDFGTGTTFNETLGEASPQSFYDGSLIHTQTMLNADLQHEYEFTSGIRSLSVAAGLEYRRERYQIIPGEPASYAANPVPSGYPGYGGSESFPGFAIPEDQYRHNAAAYVDLDADITERWEGSGAARFEKYSDFGSNVSYKAATRYKLADNLTLRGAASTGFRAPALQQEYYTTQISASSSGGLVLTNLLPVSDPAAQALGAKPLKPEKSVNFSAGFVWTPVRRVSVTLDAFRIDINNRIALTDILTPNYFPNVVSILQANGHPNSQAAYFFVNGYDSRTQGVDAVASWALPWQQLGHFDLTGSFNYTENGIRQILAYAPTGRPLIGPYSQTLYTTAQPRTKLALSLDWKREAQGATLRLTRYGSVTSEDQNGGDYGLPSDNFTQGAKILTDLEYRYDVMKGLQAAVGANNLFDVYPDAYPLKRACSGSPVPSCSSTALDAVYPFGVVSPFGMNGRFVYARVNYNW